MPHRSIPEQKDHPISQL